MTQQELYISVAKYCPEQFRAFLFNRDQNCNGCVNYVKSEIEKVETRGCKAGINFHWALENECDQRKEPQTTLFDIIGEQ